MRFLHFRGDRDRVQAHLDALAYPFDQFQLDHFLAHIARIRRKPIQIVPMTLNRTLYGVWVPIHRIDYIIYNATLQPIHQTHVILHEIAHMVLGHRLQPVSAVLGPELHALLSDSSGLGHLRTAPTATSIHQPEEQEAERFVYLIQKQVRRAQRLAELTKESTSIERLKPIADAMGYTEP